MRFHASLRVSLILAWVAPGVAAPPAREPADLLSKASSAFERNRVEEIHWNWISKEKRAIRDKTGKVVQLLPDVTTESVIRSDGQRCTAVLAWGDGVEPYLINADSDSRCQATDQRTAIEISALLKSQRVRLVSESGANINLSITPDKDRLQSSLLEERCAASIRATLLLDARTLFPRLVQGEVVENGCDAAQPTNVYYGGPLSRQMVRSSFHRGTAFRIEYELQRDKFQSPDRNFWIPVRWHANIPRWIQGGTFFTWGRGFTIAPEGAAQHIVEDTETSAQEFGSESSLK